MNDTDEFAARLRGCHAAAFGIDKPDWSNAPHHERTRWLMVATRFETMMTSPVMRRSDWGWLLYDAWNLERFAVAWRDLSTGKQNGWRQAAINAHWYVGKEWSA